MRIIVVADDFYDYLYPITKGITLMPCCQMRVCVCEVIKNDMLPPWLFGYRNDGNRSAKYSKKRTKRQWQTITRNLFKLNYSIRRNSI